MTKFFSQKESWDMEKTNNMTDIRCILRDLAQQRKSVKKQFEYGILDDIGAANEIAMISRKERNLKKELVKEVHVTNNGSPRIIKYDEGKGLWRTLLPGKKPLYGIDEETLYAYLTCLRRLCANLNLPVTNNHAFRMSLNSNVFIPLGIPATERASMLGHSVETNLKYYSFERKDSIDDICSLLDRQNQEVSPESNQNVISFPKTKTPEAL